MPKYIFVIALLTFARCVFAVDTIQPELPGASGAGSPLDPNLKPLDYPADLRKFREKALKADGVFTPDIAFTVTHCSKCTKPYVFGIFPRLTRKPFDGLEDVHRTIEETVRRPAPQKMYSPRAKKTVPRACPYCGEPERDAVPTRVLFCHLMLDSGDDLHIDYTIENRALKDRTFFRAHDGKYEKIELPQENETAFKKAFGCHFSLRAVWREIFAANWDSDKVAYENVAPGMYFIFRPWKVADADFRAFADNTLKPERDAGKFSWLETMLKTDKFAEEDTYLRWGNPIAKEKELNKSAAECFVGISFPELRKAAQDAIASRRATLTIEDSTEKRNIPGKGFVERKPLKIPANLAPMVQAAAVMGLSLQHTCSLYLAEGSYMLDHAEAIGKALQAALKECDSDFTDGRYMLLRDSKKTERKIDLLTLAGKLDPNDKDQFAIYIDYALRWDRKEHLFGPAPKEFEISPVGLPAFVEKRIRPSGFFEKQNAASALHEPGKDADGNAFDYCYTSECTSTVVYVDPAKPRFKEIPDINAARQQFALNGGKLPAYVDAEDTLTFPGLLPGLLQCKAAIVCGMDVASLASDDSRASGLADFCGVETETERIHFYALSTHCAVLAPRKLRDEELKLVRSRLKDLLVESQVNPGLELNLHFDLPRVAARGRVLRRAK